MFYRKVTVVFCTLYKKMCVLTQSHDMVYWCTVSIGHEMAINGRKLQLNKYYKSVKPCCLQTLAMKLFAATELIYIKVTHFSGYLEGECRRCLRNFGTPATNYTVSQAVILWYWYSPMWSHESFASGNTVWSNIQNLPASRIAVCSRRSRCVLQLCPTYRLFNSCYPSWTYLAWTLCHFLQT
jgi:hypothetical protein